LRGRSFIVSWREDNTVAALKAAYLGERDGVIRCRPQALWLLGAGRLHWCWMPSLTAAETRGVVRGLRQATGLSALVWDRAPSHRDASVRALGLRLVELPPYSPELNPAERVFEEVRRAVEGKIYATLDEKAAAVTEILRKIEAVPEGVRSLARWDWVDAAIEQLPSNYAA